LKKEVIEEGALEGKKKLLKRELLKRKMLMRKLLKRKMLMRKLLNEFTDKVLISHEQTEIIVRPE